MVKQSQPRGIQTPVGGARHRVCVAAIFALNGFLLALWVAHIPAILTRTDTTYDQLGLLLLLLGGSAFLSMQIAGPTLDRFGSRPGAIAAAGLLCVAVLGPASAGSTPALAGAVVALGLTNGFLDVSMNAQAVQVERAYARPIMSSFHGFFSVGGLAGSLLVAAALRAEVGVVPTVIGGGILGLVVLIAVAGGLVEKDYGRSTAVGGAHPAVDTVTVAWWREVPLGRLAVLSLIAFLLMLSEGTGVDWSALHVVDTHHVSQAAGAIAFGAFNAAMTVTRFLADPIAARLGPVVVVRGGALISIGGLGVALAAPTATTAIIGWAVFGVGVAGIVPQLFTAAGNLSERASGRAISVVVGCGYLGLLAGPAVVGFIAERSTLGTGLAPVFVALIVAVLGAGVVRPRRTLSFESGGDDPPARGVPH